EFDDQAVLSPDGTTMTFLSQAFNADTLRVWDLVGGKETGMLALPVRRNEISVFRRNALSPDGSLCAIHMRQAGQVFDPGPGKELFRLPNPNDTVRAVVFAGTDYLVTTDKEQKVAVWEARTGKPIRQFAHGSPAEVLAASPDGRLLATLEHPNYAIHKLLD